MTIAVAADPHAPRFRVFDSSVGPHLFIVPHSRIFAVDRAFAEAFSAGESWTITAAERLTEPLADEPTLDLVPETTPQSISLNVSPACNLSCSYCYAGRGSFDGAQTRAMNFKTAQAAIDRLFELANPAFPITIGFIGGEPLLNRALLNRVVDYAWSSGRKRALDVRFSVTTNGTLLTSADLDLLRTYPFAVTVSLDGGRELHDAQRPMAAGHSSFDALAAAITPLLAAPGRAKLAAHATVVRTDLDLSARFDAITHLGFHEVGLSPVRVVKNGAGALRDSDWSRYLDAMIALADREMATALAGGPIRLTNLAVALKQLHRGFSMPYPCGAGGGYFSVAADGTWYACHRAIGQEAYALGDNAGLDDARRTAFLRARHVHAQSECRRCWARYLCAGGCHQEVSARADSSCGFIRGWLDYCLGRYCELVQKRPRWFTIST